MAKIKVGDKFTLNCGVEVEVVEYVGWDEIYVAFNNRYKQRCSSQQLRSKSLRFRGDDGKIIRVVKVVGNLQKQRASVGDKFILNCGVVVTIVKYDTAARVTISDSIGRCKIVQFCTLKSGSISWFGITKNTSDVTGKKFILKCGTTVTVKEHLNYNKAIVEDNFGNTREVYLSSLKTGSLWWTTHVEITGHYVYICFVGSTVLYIGSGKGKRFLHVASGISENFKLNKHYFCEENSIEIIVIRSGLTKQESLELEKDLIVSLNPPYNTIHNRCKE